MRAAALEESLAGITLGCSMLASKLAATLPSRPVQFFQLRGEAPNLGRDSAAGLSCGSCGDGQMKVFRRVTRPGVTISTEALTKLGQDCPEIGVVAAESVDYETFAQGLRNAKIFISPLGCA